LERIPARVAGMWIKGFSVELMDGDHSYVPELWISAVMRHAKPKLLRRLGLEEHRNPRVAMVPILGTQSTGKSTFLNILFGLQFKVAQIRCTKGIFMQMLFIDEQTKSNLDIQFDAIIICDTEGLRALDLQLADIEYQCTKHDNRMATFVMSMSDLTLINVMNLRTDQICEVLEIVTYTMVKLDPSQEKQMIDASYLFIHQDTEGMKTA
jgi:GTPase Era involved in 16S rRNA processing